MGVVAAAAPVMALSHEAGEPVPCDEMATFADGLAVRVAIPLAVAELQRATDRMLAGVRARDRAGGRRLRPGGIRAEGAAGAALAAPGAGGAGPVVVIMCGANIDDDLHGRAVERPGSFPD